MLPYLIVFFLSALMFYLSSRYEGIWRYVFLFIAVLIPSILAGCRDLTVGRDFDNYINYVWNQVSESDDILDMLLVKVLGDIEMAYILFNYVVSLFTDDIHWFLFVYQLVIMLIMAKVFLMTRESGNAHHFIMFYFLYYYCECLSMMRQSLAIVLALLAVAYLLEKKIGAYYLVGIMAFFFHNSAVFVLIVHPLFILIKKYGEYRLLNTVLICIAALLLAVVFKSVVNYLVDSGLIMSKYGAYTIQEDMHAHKIDILFLGVICLYMIQMADEYYCEYTLLLFYLLLIALLLTFFGEITEIANRIAYYFVLPALMLIPFLRNVSEKHDNLFMLTYVMIFIYFVYLAVFTGIADTIPYQSSILGI